MSTAGQMHMRRAQPAESRALRAWIVERHYTETAPPGFAFVLEALLDNERVGALMFGRPAARELDADLWLELTRMVFVDETPAHVESRGLALARRYIRRWQPNVVGLIAYSDPSVGHDGVVYRADGWAPFGRTRNSRSGWSTRPGRKPPAGERPSRKQRWVRAGEGGRRW